MLIDPTMIALIDERLEAVQAKVDAVRLSAANVRMANADNERYVVLDNLRRLPGDIAELHLRLGRLYAAIEGAEGHVPVR